MDTLFKVTPLNRLRQFEMEQILPLFPAGARILELGAGTGQQARFLAEHGFDVLAIDLPNSDYAADRVFEVQDYDGRTIPLADQSVDIVFSSNVLEHVDDLPRILAELKRVQKPAGFGIHLMPTPAWRFWTFLTGFFSAAHATGLLAKHVVSPPAGQTRWRAVKRDARTIAGGLIPVGHGTSPEGISELWTFSPRTWRRRFEMNGFTVIEDRPFGLFYTGAIVFGDRLSFAQRKRLSRTLGSAVHIYVVKPTQKDMQ